MDYKDELILSLMKENRELKSEIEDLQEECKSFREDFEKLCEIKLIIDSHFKSIGVDL